MLWTDSVFVGLDDLHRIDSEVSQVAEAEGITLTGNNGLLRGAVEEASNELQKIIVAFGGYLGSGDVSPNHLAAVLNVGLGNAVRQKALLNQVVIDGDTVGSWNWIKQWAVFWALQVFYRDAFNRTVKDRYEGKMRFYKSELSRRVTPSLFGLGIPVVIRPLARPAATFERDSGTWDSSNLSLVSGVGVLNGVDYDVAITYVDMSQPNLYVSPSSIGNAESAPSDRAVISLTTGNVIHIDISSLGPPTGIQHPSQVLLCVISPLRATHWNVYVGPSGGTMRLQNATPIAIATTTYTLAADPTATGSFMGVGQYGSRRLSLTPTRQRA